MSVRKQGNCYQVTYRCPGEKTPRTESYKSREEAEIRDAQIRLSKKNGTFVPPARLAKRVIQQKENITMKDFLDKYVEIYGLKKWGDSYFSANVGLIRNYIIPYIGDRYVRSMTVKDMDAYYTMLLDQPAVVVQGHQDTGARISAHTINRIHKLLKSAFNKAVVWEDISANPTIGATVPEAKSEKREVWSDDEAVRALKLCEDPILRLCLYLALGCSMRLGEILGLQWANVYMDDAEPHLAVDRELRRCNNASIKRLEKVNRSKIIFKFPPVMAKKCKTTLALKVPKTESSIRTIYLPKAVIEELRKAKTQQEEDKQVMGENYHDYDLVVAQLNGRPYEQRGIDKSILQFIEDNQLRPVVFHSLRHSSTSLKLKLSRGNIKAVQGDTGHAEARMVTDTYAHGFDADRKLIAQEMDSGFFAKVDAPNGQNAAEEATLQQMKNFFQLHPELLPELLKEVHQE